MGKKAAIAYFIFILALFLGSLDASIAFAEPYGWSPDTDNSDNGPPVCSETFTRQPVLYQPNHFLLPKAKNRGELRLWWHPTDEASSYNIYYGLTPGNYIFAARELGNGETNNFTLEYLANKKYYFVVQANKGCAAGPRSNEWMGKPTKGGFIPKKTSTKI